MSESGNQYDLIIIGAGPGGYEAAIRAAQLGMHVACVEREDRLGGTCLRVGCVPSKALLHSSELYHKAATEFADHGISTGELGVDVPAMIGRKDGTVEQLTKGIAGLFKKNKIERIQGTARISGPGEVVVEGPDAGKLNAHMIMIATGSTPVTVPGLEPDGEHVVTSTEALDFQEVPERLLVVGGGYIGLEMGSVWNRLGSEVICVEMMDRVVPAMDRELGRQLQRILKKQGFDFRMKTKVTGAEVNGDGRVDVRLEDDKGEKSYETVDRVLMAVGRKPYTEGLGLEEAGVETDEGGRIVVDSRFQTNVDGLFAIGDVIAGPMLAHKASEDGIACVELMAGQAGHVDYDLVPAVIFTEPEFASIGRTEEQLKEDGVDYRAGKFPFMANSRAKATGEADGQVKVLADAATDEILGVHILGPHASDLIHECAVAMAYRACAEDISRICHAHPTYPEAVKEASLAALGRAINI